MEISFCQRNDIGKLSTGFNVIYWLIDVFTSTLDGVWELIFDGITGGMMMD